jgi:large subunit ribosomal protein L35Ae
MVKSQARLYSRAVFMGFRGGRTTQSENQAILKLEGVGTKADANWYLGKRVAYVYRAKKARKTFDKHESKQRAMYGKVIGTHGSNGAVRAKFAHNLPPSAMGHPVRVMLYPHRDA